MYIIKGFVVDNINEIRMVSDTAFPSFTIGRDLEEISMGGIGVSIEYPSQDYPIQNRALDIIRDLRFLAERCNCDYFSYEKFKGDIGKYYGRVTDEDICVMCVEPRLFLKI